MLNIISYQEYLTQNHNEIPMRMARITKSDNNKCWQQGREIRTPYTAWGGENKKNGAVTSENSMAGLQTIKHTVTI